MTRAAVCFAVAVAGFFLAGCGGAEFAQLTKHVSTVTHIAEPCYRETYPVRKAACETQACLEALEAEKGIVASAFDYLHAFWCKYGEDKTGCTQ